MKGIGTMKEARQAKKKTVAGGLVLDAPKSASELLNERVKKKVRARTNLMKCVLIAVQHDRFSMHT